MKRGRPRRSSARQTALAMGYRSGFEQLMAEGLDAGGIDYGYEISKIKYTPPVKVRTYTPDFTLIKKDGTEMYLETKGYWPAAERTKMKLIKQSNPEADIRIVFQNSKTKIRKGSTTTYAMVAQKLGYLWCDLKVGFPEEWILELKD